MARCYPPLDKIDRLRVPLMPGEAHLLQCLLDNLDDTFEIFVQPFLNGDRPDFVIMRRDFGVLIIEVKDWNLRHYRNPKGELAPWILIQNNATIASPLAQVQEYKKNFYDLHIDSLFERNIKNRKTFSIVQPAVYFHNSTNDDVANFCGTVPYMHLLGRDGTHKETLQRLINSSGLNNISHLFDRDLYESFRRFLIPPEHSPEMGQPIIYTQKQLELIESRVGARQKVRGVAGCGKTKVLAGRAVNAHRRTHGTVLVLTFNITLRNYIHDRISEVRLPFPWTAFEITSYHQFIATQANNYNAHYENILAAADDENFFDQVKNDIQRYETILVDEVQDYEYSWLKILVKYFLHDTGEFVVFGDEKQNVYGRTMGEDKFPRVPTAIGRWNILNASFRMHSATLQIAKEFQRQYFDGRYTFDEDATPKQGDLFEDEEQGIIRYISAIGYSGIDLYNTVREQALALRVHPNDLVILSLAFNTLRDIEYGFRIVAHERTTNAGETKEEYEKILKENSNKNKIKLALNQIRRGRKLHFWGNAGTTKFSTVHSFKGWEAHTLILIIADTDRAEISRCLDELIYVALTRVRQNLVVIDTTLDGKYRDFFEFVSGTGESRAS